jgi:hypothetical protein
MRYKVTFYPMYEETLVIESLVFDTLENGVDYTHHYTLKTPHARSWSSSSWLRELADRLDSGL